MRFLFHRLRGPSFSRFSSQLKYSLNHLRDDPSLNSVYYIHVLLTFKVQNWTQHCRGGLTSTEKKERITFLKFLAMLCLMQPKILSLWQGYIAGTCPIWHPPRPSGSFLPDFFLNAWPQHTLVHGIVPLQVQEIALFLVELHKAKRILTVLQKHIFIFKFNVLQ